MNMAANFELLGDLGLCVSAAKEGGTGLHLISPKSQQASAFPCLLPTKRHHTAELEAPLWTA